VRQDLEQRSFKLKSWLSHSHSTTQLHIFLLYTHRTHRRRVSVVVVVVVYTIQQWHGQSVLINYKKEKNNIYVHLCFLSFKKFETVATDVVHSNIDHATIVTSFDVFFTYTVRCPV